MRKKAVIVITSLILFLVAFLCFKTLFKTEHKNEKENFNLVFTNAKTDKDALVKISKDGKTLIFTTEKYENIGDTTILTFMVENKGNVDAKINGVICTAKGVYKDPDNKTDEEIKNAEKNAIDYSNYVTAGLSNKIANTKLKVGKTSKKETLTINVTRKLKHNKSKSLTYECKIDAIKDSK